MAIEYVRHDEDIDYLFFRRPRKKPRDFIILRGLLIAAGVFAVVNIVTFLQDMVPIIQASEFLRQAIADPNAPDEPQLRDLVKIFGNSAIFIFLTLIATMIVLPARYLWLVLRLGRGHPRTRDKIRTLALISIFLEVFLVISFTAIFAELEFFDVPFRFGPNMVIAPLILFYAFRPDIKRFFSYHKVRALAKDEGGFERIDEPPSGFAQLPPDPSPVAPDNA